MLEVYESMDDRMKRDQLRRGREEGTANADPRDLVAKSRRANACKSSGLQEEETTRAGDESTIEEKEENERSQGYEGDPMEEAGFPLTQAVRGIMEYDGEDEGESRLEESEEESTEESAEESVEDYVPPLTKEIQVGPLQMSNNPSETRLTREIGANFRESVILEGPRALSREDYKEVTERDSVDPWTCAIDLVDRIATKGVVYRNAGSPTWWRVKKVLRADVRVTLARGGEVQGDYKMNLALVRPAVKMRAAKMDDPRGRSR